MQGYLLRILGFLILCTLALSLWGEEGWLRWRALHREKHKLEERILTLLYQNRTLHQYIERLRKEDFFLEKVAREELGLAREGEILYRFPSWKGKGGIPSSGYPNVSLPSSRKGSPEPEEPFPPEKVTLPLLPARPQTPHTPQDP